MARHLARLKCGIAPETGVATACALAPGAPPPVTLTRDGKARRPEGCDGAERYVCMMSPLS
eukprot:2208247-Prymnesium_polylepis.1